MRRRSTNVPEQDQLALGMIHTLIENYGFLATLHGIQGFVQKHVDAEDSYFGNGVNMAPTLEALDKVEEEYLNRFGDGCDY